MHYKELFLQYILLFFVLRNALQVTHLTPSKRSASTSRATWSILCLYLLYAHRLFPGLTHALLPLYQIHKRTTKFWKPCLETTIYCGLSPLEYNLIQAAVKSRIYATENLLNTTTKFRPILSSCMSQQPALVYANINEAVHFSSLNVSPIDSPWLHSQSLSTTVP